MSSMRWLPPSRHSMLLAPVVLLLMLHPGCAKKGAPGAPANTAKESKEKAVKLGREATQALMAALAPRVRGAMQKGGPGSAIEVCATEANRLARQVEAKLSRGIRIKRTSDRIRSPRNAPDANERKALALFADLNKRNGRLPGHHLEVDRTPQGDVYRYYQPIRVAGFCLVCHGPRAKLSPVVQEALTKRYPADAATGYQANDLRGIFSVTIPASALR